MVRYQENGGCSQCRQQTESLFCCKLYVAWKKKRTFLIGYSEHQRKIVYLVRVVAGDLTGVTMKGMKDLDRDSLNISWRTEARRRHAGDAPGLQTAKKFKQLLIVCQHAVVPKLPYRKMRCQEKQSAEMIRVRMAQDDVVQSTYVTAPQEGRHNMPAQVKTAFLKTAAINKHHLFSRKFNHG